MTMRIFPNKVELFVIDNDDAENWKMAHEWKDRINGCVCIMEEEEAQVLQRMSGWYVVIGTDGSLKDLINRLEEEGFEV